MKKRILKKTGSVLLATLMAAGTITAMMPKVEVETEAAENSDLQLLYDEPAVADFYEVYAKKFKWLAGKGDGFLEFGRNDPPNYVDGKSHGGDSKYTEAGSVSQAVYDHVSWAKHALPVGNGHMGAMSFGYTDTERVQMNEDTLWTGGPNCTTLSESNNADAYGNVNLENPQKLMSTLVDNAFTNYYNSLESGSMPSDENVSPYKNGLTPNSKEQEGSYQSFCDMMLDFGIDVGKTENYSRGLNLNNAVSFVNYDYDGVTYNRDMFASYPDDVIVYKISASEKGKVNFTLHPEIPHTETLSGSYFSTYADGAANYGKDGSVVAKDDTIYLSGTLNHNGMKFAGTFKVVTTGGTMEASNETNNAKVNSEDNGKITVKDADEAYIVVSLTTDYTADFDKNYTTGETLEQLLDNVKNITDTAAEKGYDKLLENHLTDYQSLFNRVSIDIGGTCTNTTTDELLDKYKEAYQSGESSDYDHYLETLYYQYGRYMLIESSRQGSLPANLQGVWNDMDAAPWSSDYHTNINVQMNYWLAEETNLAEMAQPLVDFANDLRKPGRLSLAKLYGIGYDSDESKIDLNTEDGFIFFCNTTPLGFTGNISSNASFTATATAFLAQNLYDYYAFTQDKDYLKENIYPFLRESSITYLQTLQAGRTDSDKDKLYIVPSWSSEQTASPWTVGTYFDQQLVWQLFNDTIEAMEDLGITPAENMNDEGDVTYKNDDSKLLARLKDAIDRLDPVALGSDGQIKEWQQEYGYNKTKRGANIGESTHRHISQLIALYPGNYITKDDTDLIEGAKIVLENRTDTSTGWGLADRLNLWARTGDGNHSYKLVNALLATATYDNLFDTHAPFQIDGNFGATAGITEMLLQSNAGKVELLAALPDDWDKGSYEGLVARGNFEVDCEWSDKTADYARITAKSGGTLVLDGIDVSRITDESGNAVSYTKDSDGNYVVETTKGQVLNVYASSYTGADKTPKPTPTSGAITTPNVTSTPVSTKTPTVKPTSTPDVTATVTPSSTPTPDTNVLLGDVNENNKVELTDASLLLRAALGIEELTDAQKLRADVNEDGQINLADVTLVLKYALGIIDSYK